MWVHVDGQCLLFILHAAPLKQVANAKAANFVMYTTGNHCLAIFKEPESYSLMRVCLSDIRQEIESLSSITVDGVTFEIEYYL